MRRTLAKLAEVARRAHDPLAEMHFPDAIHDHSRRERIARADDRLGQLQPPAALGETRRLAIAQDAQVSPRRDLAQGSCFSANRNPDVRWLFGIADSVQEWILLRRLERGKLRFQSGVVFSGFRGEERIDLLGAEVVHTALEIQELFPVRLGRQVPPEIVLLDVETLQVRVLARLLVANTLDAAERNVVPVVLDLLLVEHRDHEGLEFLG